MTTKFWTLLHKVGDPTESINIFDEGYILIKCSLLVSIGLVLFVFSFSKHVYSFQAGPKCGCKFGILEIVKIGKLLE